MPGLDPLPPFEEQEEEEYGRLDGVRLNDHVETYGYLSELRCITSTEGEIYQRISDCFKICSTCFFETPEALQQEYVTVPSHNLVHKDSAESQMNCTQCYQTIIRINPADECMGCIEAYLDAHEAYLNEGWGVPVSE